MFEDQTVEILPTRTTMKAMARHSAARVMHVTHITFNVIIQYFTINNTQVSLGDNSPNSAVIVLATS